MNLENKSKPLLQNSWKPDDAVIFPRELLLGVTFGAPNSLRFQSVVGFEPILQFYAFAKAESLRIEALSLIFLALTQSCWRKATVAMGTTYLIRKSSKPLFARAWNPRAHTSRRSRSTGLFFLSSEALDREHSMTCWRRSAAQAKPRCVCLSFSTGSIDCYRERRCWS